MSAVLADAGCDTASNPPSCVFTSQAQDYVRTELLIETGFAAVVERGASEKTIAQLVTLVATKARLAQQLGLERRQRPVASPMDYLAGILGALLRPRVAAAYERPLTCDVCRCAPAVHIDEGWPAAVCNCCRRRHGNGDTVRQPRAVMLPRS